MPEKTRNEEYNEQLRAIRENQRAGYDNSPEFTRLNTALGKLNEVMTRLSQPGVLLTGASIAELRPLYTEAAIAADKYIEHLPTWVPAIFRSGEGSRRETGVKSLRKFITQDMEALDRYRANNPMGLETLLRDGRRAYLVEPERPLQHLGSVMSDRVILAGNGTKGVFTENTDIMKSKEVFGFALNRELVHLPEGSGDREYLNELNRMNSVSSTLSSLRDDIGSEEFGKVVEGLQNGNLDTVQISGKTWRRMRQVRDAFRRAGCGFNLLLNPDDVTDETTLQDSEFGLALGNFLEKTQKIYAANGVLKRDLHVEKDSSIGDRNTAMTIVSDLIYKPDLLARSSDMRMKLRNGTDIRGCYMEWAPGSDIANLGKAITGDAKDIKDARVIYDTPEIVKEAGDMLALDYICGNIDRHMGNFHIGLEKGRDGIYRVKTLKGIDNDQSFPVVGPDELKKLKGHYTHIRNVEDFACMKRSTADSILALTKEKLTFALCHKLTEKEINAAWERTKFLQGHIRAGMNHDWISEDEIEAGMIHVIDDNSRAWDHLTLSKVAKVAPPNSFYAQIQKKFVISGIPDLQRTRAKALSDLEKPALEQRYQELVKNNDPSVQNNRHWVDEQLKSRKTANEIMIQNLEETEKHIGPDEILPPLPTASQMNIAFQRMDRAKATLLKGDEMYQVYHSRRNLSNATMEYANRALRDLENEQMEDFFAPGYDSHSVVRVAGMEEPNDRYYIDGEPAQNYARRKYWSRDINARYEALEDPDEKKRFMKQFVAAHILGAMTSGRHHVDLVCFGRGDKGQPLVQPYEVNLNLGEADINGRQKRIDKLAENTDGRAERQNDIKIKVGQKITQKLKDGTLNNYRNNARAWLNAQKAQNAAAQGNPNRIEQVAFEALDIERPRRNAIHRKEDPARQMPGKNQPVNLKEDPEVKSTQSKRHGK